MAGYPALSLSTRALPFSPPRIRLGLARDRRLPTLRLSESACHGNGQAPTGGSDGRISVAAGGQRFQRKALITLEGGPLTHSPPLSKTYRVPTLF